MALSPFDRSHEHFAGRTHLLWQCCRDVRLLGQLSDGTKNSLLALETDRFQASWLDTEAEIEREIGGVSASSEARVRELGVELGITKLELFKKSRENRELQARLAHSNPEIERRSMERKTLSAVADEPFGEDTDEEVMAEARMALPRIRMKHTLRNHLTATGNYGDVVSSICRDLDSQMRVLELKYDSVSSAVHDKDLEETVLCREDTSISKNWHSATRGNDKRRRDSERHVRQAATVTQKPPAEERNTPLTMIAKGTHRGHRTRSTEQTQFVRAKGGGKSPKDFSDQTPNNIVSKKESLIGEVHSVLGSLDASQICYLRNILVTSSISPLQKKTDLEQLITDLQTFETEIQNEVLTQIPNRSGVLQRLRKALTGISLGLVDVLLEACLRGRVVGIKPRRLLLERLKTGRGPLQSAAVVLVGSMSEEEAALLLPVLSPDYTAKQKLRKTLLHGLREECIEVLEECVDQAHMSLCDWFAEKASERAFTES